MASVSFNGMDSYMDYLEKLGDKTDDVLKEAVKRGTKIALGAVKGASGPFSRYVKTRAPKKNEWGWFGQVQFKGKVSGGISAAKAVMIYEHGKDGQAPRPFLNKAVSSVEGSVQEEINKVIEENMKQ